VAVDAESREQEGRKGVAGGQVVLRRHSRDWSRQDATAGGIAQAGKATVSSLRPRWSLRRAVGNATDRIMAMLCSSQMAHRVMVAAVVVVVVLDPWRASEQQMDVFSSD
jgi:hypothetical protein